MNIADGRMNGVRLDASGASIVQHSILDVTENSVKSGLHSEVYRREHPSMHNFEIRAKRVSGSGK